MAADEEADIARLNRTPQLLAAKVLHVPLGKTDMIAVVRNSVREQEINFLRNLCIFLPEPVFFHREGLVTERSRYPGRTVNLQALEYHSAVTQINQFFQGLRRILPAQRLIVLLNPVVVVSGN